MTPLTHLVRGRDAHPTRCVVWCSEVPREIRDDVRGILNFTDGGSGMSDLVSVTCHACLAAVADLGDRATIHLVELSDDPVTRHPRTDVVLSDMSDDWLRHFREDTRARRDAACDARDRIAHLAYIDRLVDVDLTLARRNVLRAEHRSSSPGDLFQEVLATIGVIADLLAGTCTRLDGAGNVADELQREGRSLWERVCQLESCWREREVKLTAAATPP